MQKQPAKLSGGIAVLALAGVLGMAQAPRASAFTIDGDRINGIGQFDVGQSFEVTFDGNVETSTVDGLSSIAQITLTSFNLTEFGKTEVELDIDLSNTSSIDSRTSAFGFDIDNATIESVAIYPNGLFANGHTNGIEVCFNDGNNCQENHNGGLSAGESGQLYAKLTLSESVQTFAISDFGVSYQSIGDGELSGASGTGRGTLASAKPARSTSIPEPSTTIGIFLLGLGFLGGARKKRQASL
ncbi:MAG: cistern family PEP-CTERM protein [Oscillatoria sp. SIO1A7]|nr:cistern family PEP-CTERM protein [Oscillatoria sp. SIO1A7]